ncbi:MAG TPA: hypothetical protein VGR73_00690 [Bryobacteraceae bacterium]|nr:hypothetical protein [Bryobacteraceae bacterium]
MNLAHLHLLLNHFPIIGTLVGVGLFLFSLTGRNDDLKRASLIIFAVMALLSLPTFFSGVGAQGAIEEQPGVSKALINRHEGAAILALLFMELTGALSLAALWQSHKSPKPARWNVAAVLILALITVGLMTRVGTTGGDVRHPEISDSSDPAANEGTLGSLVQAFEPSPAKFTKLMTANKYWWAFMMDLHFIGLVMIIGAVGALDLRMLGFAKEFPIASMHRLVPWGLAGFAINVVTGVLAFIGMPAYYTYDLAFWIKIFAVLLLGLNAAAFYLTDTFRVVEHMGPGEDAPPPAKLIAASSLVLWIGVITLGRYIQLYQGSIATR